MVAAFEIGGAHLRIGQQSLPVPDMVMRPLTIT